MATDKGNRDIIDLLSRQTAVSNQWLVDVFLQYLDEWEDEAASHE